MDETFTKEPRDLVVSSLGYSVQPLGRLGIRYIDHGIDIEIDAEALNSIRGYIVYTSSIHASEAEVARIMANVHKAFDVLGYVLQKI
jgi:hypothetical protein